MAGDRLVEGSAGTAIEDALLYPILTLYRHHLELELKRLVRISLNYSTVSRAEIEGDEKKLTNTHGLTNLWSLLQKHYPKRDDWATAEAHAAFESLLFEFDQHDPNSQATRYPMDKSGRQTLTDLRYVDLRALETGVHKMSNYLGCIHEGIGQATEGEGHE
jgi:hypothetical protein